MGRHTPSMRALLFLGWLASLSAFLVAAKTASPAAQVDAVHQLNEDNIREKTAKGLWLIEHYSPGCGHCRQFAPTYEKLAVQSKDMEDTRGLFLGQINCQAQGDLCNEHEIKYYPQIKLYRDGQEIDTFSDDRTLERLTAYLETHSRAYIRDLADVPAQGAFAAGNPNVNERGESEPLNREKLDEAKKKGPVFVKFYAPCCKKLAPTWSEFATSVRGELAIGEVDCDEHGALCKAEGIKGYPTLIMFNHGKAQAYEGPRSLEGLKKFAEDATASPEIRSTDAQGIERIAAQTEVFFVLLQTFASPAHAVTAAKDILASTTPRTPIYTTRDPDVFASTGIDPSQGPIFACYKDHSVRPVATLILRDKGESRAAEDMRAFYFANRRPTVTELTQQNYDDVMRSPTRALIVLAALDKGSKSVAQELADFAIVARAWQKGGRSFQQPVWFVWVDSHKWGKWLRRSFRIKRSAQPKVVLVDPAISEYYDTTLEKTPMGFDGTSIFSTLEGAYQHSIKPKYIETALERSSRSLTAYASALADVAVTHPISAMLVFGALFGGILYALQHCLSRARSKAGNNRLD